MNKQEFVNHLNKNVPKDTISINQLKNVSCKVMIHIHCVLLKGHSGTIRHTAVINVVTTSLFMINLKKHAEFVLNKRTLMSSQENVSRNQFHLNALQMNITTLKLNNVKSEAQHQCVHLPLHIGIL